MLTADHGQRLRLTCSRDELLARLQVVGRAVSARSSVQILSGILFDAGDGERPPMLAATDMELSVRAPLDAEIAEGGRAVLPGRLLLDIVRRLPAGSVSIALAEGGGLATIEAGASEYKLHTYGADDYPELPEIDRERLFTVEREAFLEAIERVVHAASRDEARPVLTGVHVELGLGTLTVAATDSYRLAVRTATLDGGPAEDIQAIVPARALGELVRIAQGSTATSVEIVAERNQMLFGIDDVWLSARVIEGQFPNFRALRPDAFEHEVVLPAHRARRGAVAHGAARPAHVAAATALRAGRAHGVGPDAGGRRGPRAAALRLPRRAARDRVQRRVPARRRHGSRW